MLTRRVALVTLSVLLIVSGMAPFVSAADSEYAITVDTEIDTPTRTVSLEGESYTVESMGKASTGGELTFSVATPGVDRYRVYLYNSERKIVEWTEQTQDGTVSFGTSGLSPGTYLLAVSVNGVRKTVQPVVITEYSIEVDAPTDTPVGSSFTVEATLSGTSTTPEHVTVVLSNETWHQQYTASQSDGAYSADIPGTLAADEYAVYVTTHNDNEVNGRNEVTGLSASSSITVTATDAGGSTPPNGPGGGGDASTESSPTQTASPTTENGSDGANTTVTDTVDSTPDTSTESPAPTAPTEPTPTQTEATDEHVIQPATTTASTTQTTMPGVPVLLFLLLAGGGALAHLRSAGRR